MTWYAIEGLDGSGKTTACEALKRYLSSCDRVVLDITHPNRDRMTGRMAERSLLTNGGRVSALLSAFFYLLDVLCSVLVLRKYRTDYDDVIFVRYSLAAAYVPTPFVPLVYRVMERLLPVPDVRILVDIEPEIAFERIVSRGGDLEIFESIDKLRHVRGKMFSIADSWHVVDNNGTPEELERQVIDHVSVHHSVDGAP